MNKMEFVGSESFGAIQKQNEQVKLSELSSEFQYFTNNAPLDLPDGPNGQKKTQDDQNLKIADKEPPIAHESNPIE